MTRHAKTLVMYQRFATILAERRPMTVRQVYYQMVVNGWVENTPRSYDLIQRNLDQARWDCFDGLTDGDGHQIGISPEWIEDRIREYRGGYIGFRGLPQFWEYQQRQLALGYGLDPRQGQANYVEMWCEKDALSGVFERILQAADFPYPVPLNVCRGYPSQSFLREASRRFQREERAGRRIHILYCGDFDPSGENIAASTGWGEDEGDVQSRLRRLGCLHTTVRKVALTADQFTRWFDETAAERLPHDPNPIKDSDKRAKAFERRFGKYGAELDAVPPEWLADILREEVTQLIDLDAYAEVLEREELDREAIQRVVDNLRTDDERDDEDTDE